MTPAAGRARAGAGVAGIAAAVLLAACGGGAGGVDRLTASGAWARPTPPGATDGVVYLDLRTDRADALAGATVDAGVAERASLHATVSGDRDGAGGHHGGGGGGTVTMVSMATIPVTPGETLRFEPGGNHVMLEGLRRPLARGGSFTLTLRLGSGRELPVTVTVADNPPD